MKKLSWFSGSGPLKPGGLNLPHFSCMPQGAIASGPKSQ